jgi:peptidoglycan hydrolase-like protein with peptidoglycan-binding domain
MALTSPRLNGDPRLVAASNNAPPMRQVQEGTSVALIQSILVELGFDLPLSTYSGKYDGTYDGIYGGETAGAVRQFQTVYGLAGKDGEVGRETMTALDRVLAGTLTPLMPPAKAAMIDGAAMRRLNALTIAERKLVAFKGTFEPNPPDVNDPVVGAMQRQLFVLVDSNFWDITNTFLSRVRANLATSSSFIMDMVTPGFYAHVDLSLDPAKGVTLGKPFFDVDYDNVRHEVVIHEFFHFVVGAGHFYTTTINSEAMKCPHHLARAVCDIALGQRFNTINPANICG